MEARTEAAHGGLMRERRFGTEEGNGHRFFQRQRAGHDLAIDRAQRVVADRTAIELANALQHGEFAMRHVDFLAALHFHLADFEDVTRALVEQTDNLLVEFVDRLPMIANVHAEGWDSGWSFGVSGVADSAGGSVCICNCSGGAVARPGSTVSRFSGFCTGMRRSSSAAGKSSRLLRPKYSRNAAVVPYCMGRPGISARPTCSTSSRSSKVCITPSTATPRTCSISVRVNGWRYAMIARVSSAGWERRAGRLRWPTSALIQGAYSGWLTNCHDPATHASR